MATIDLRPSGAPVWVPCPGAPTLWQSAPPDTGEVAMEGIAAHWFAQHFFGDPPYLPEELIDRQAPNGIFITEEMLDYVSIYTDFVKREIDNPFIEKTLPIDWVQEGMTGTPDAQGRHFDDPWCVHIADLKYGWRIVEPEKNWQLICYALAILQAAAAGAQITHFKFTIVQPRASHPSGSIRSWYVKSQTLIDFYLPRLQKAAQGGNCVTGPWCKNCSGALCCPSLRLAAHHSTEYVKSPVVEMYDGDQLAIELHMLKAAQTALQARTEAIEEIAINRIIENFGSVPGWDIDRSSGREKWNEDYDMTTMEALTGIQLHKNVALTPNQARDKGLSAEIVTANSGRGIGNPKLVPFNSSKIMRHFK